MKVNGQNVIVANAWAKPIVAKSLSSATLDVVVADLGTPTGDVTVTVRIPSNHESTTLCTHVHTYKQNAS